MWKPIPTFMGVCAAQRPQPEGGRPESPPGISRRSSRGSLSPVARPQSASEDDLAEGLGPLVDWVGQYGAFWRDRFNRLEDLLKRMNQ